MSIQTWEERYREKNDDPCSDVMPTPLVLDIAKKLPAGRALDLACGTGRNALWLAERGWSVTAVDGAPTGIEILRSRVANLRPDIKIRTADLERGEYVIEPANWDLILMCGYLQRDLFEPAKEGLVPGGVLLAIVLLAESDAEPALYRLKPGELKNYFRGWEIIHSYEGRRKHSAGQRSMAEIVARHPKSS